MDLHWITVVSLIVGGLTAIGLSVGVYHTMGWQFELERDQWRKKDGASPEGQRKA
jgi:hypothetical protein